MKEFNYPCVLTIAGTDPSGGAGIQADIKTISAIGCYAASVITALVAQNTQGVQAIQDVPVEFVREQLHSIFNDLTISAVKIGMLYDQKIIEMVACELKKQKSKNIVLDPVMIAKKGYELLPSHIIHLLTETLFPLVDLITPNLFEAEKILGEKIETLSEMEPAAKKIGDRFNVNVLLKGGHLNTPDSPDVLYLQKENYYEWFHAKRILSNNTHGTGCTLSSAIASYLAQGYSLSHAVHAAKQYLTQAIDAGKDLTIGKLCGPVDHFYFLRKDISHDIYTPM
jgi:hydroxymethylpyrimidine/phosphomethylpyrimidine kinase